MTQTLAAFSLFTQNWTSSTSSPMQSETASKVSPSVGALSPRASMTLW